jgi:hypothetical protein
MHISLRLLAGSLVGVSALWAAPLQLSVEVPDSTRLHLRAAGSTGTNVNLEVSFDLAEWFVVQAAPATGGTATFELSREEPLAMQFFRAVEAPPPFTGTVGPQPDPQYSVAGLVTPEAGGVLRLTGPDGVEYALSVRSNQVWEPVIVTLTVITNFTSLPLANAFRAAVQLEPEGLEFRGEAELRLRFPNAVPEFEMVGYGFAGDGGEFHLQPWRVQGNEVVVPLAHFSGAGVAAEPFPPSGNFLQRFDQAWDSTRDARRVADEWAAEETREASRWRQKGLFTQEQFEQQLEAIRTLRNRKEYRLGVQPLLDAALSDCAVGQVVLHRLDQLESRTGQPYGQGPFMPDIVRLSSPVRCRCAHHWLELCEQNPNVSGEAITRELTGLLQDLQLMTGLSSDPACDLGSDADILERLRHGPCHKAWEGSVRYTREETETWTTGVAGGGGAYELRKDRRSAYTFVGRVTEVLEQDGDPDPELNWESWRLRLMGRLTASLDDEEVQVTSGPDWRMTETDERQGRFDQQVKGDLVLRFEQGKPATVVASVGLEDVTYAMARKRITERAVECWGRQCPDPRPRTSQDDGTETLHFAYGGIPQDVKELSWQNGELKVVFERVQRFDPLPGFQGYVNERVERMTVQLRRAAGR